MTDERSVSLGVFVNCPFDEDYRKLFGALIFTIHDCGFVPRCVLEDSDSGKLRMDKLARLIRESPRGIHDLTRTELDEVNHLPRFNMPLELGLFLGASLFGKKAIRGKRALILDKEAFRYQKFCSDLAGYDPRAHSENPEQLIAAVRTWLRDDGAYTREVMMPGEDRIGERFQLFWAQLPDLCAEVGLRFDDMPFARFADYSRFVSVWQEQTPL